jgi:hypothetical protein
MAQRYSNSKRSRPRSEEPAHNSKMGPALAGPVPAPNLNQNWADPRPDGSGPEKLEAGNRTSSGP